jgi:hypothetical protein
MVGEIFAGCEEQRRWKCKHFQAFATQQPVKSTRSLRDRQMTANCFVSVFDRALARPSNTSSHFFAICPAISTIQLSPDPNILALKRAANVLPFLFSGLFGGVEFNGLVFNGLAADLAATHQAVYPNPNLMWRGSARRVP